MDKVDLTQPSGERLDLLYRISQTFNSSLDLDRVLNRVMDEVIAITHAERGFLMLRDAEGQMSFQVARGMEQQAIEAPEFHISRGVVEQVVEEGRPLLTDNAQDDALLGGRASIVGLGLRSILCVPLQLKGDVRGIIYVDNRLQAGIFSPADLELLSSIASSAAIAIENARLYQVAIEKGRMERELQVAREVQQSLIPQGTPQVEGWDLAAWWRPAREVSGDFYDFVPVDLNLAKKTAAGAADSWGVVLADVSDKGMPAALFMALSRSIVRASVVHSFSPADGIGRANRLICADASEGMFITLFYAQIKPQHGAFTYVNAGHDPPLHYQAQQQRWSTLDRTGMVLGVDEDVLFGQRELLFGPGDLVCLYTDGVTDATDPQGQYFGRERLQAVLGQQRQATAAEIMTALEQALQDFCGGGPSFDDITVVVIKRL
ncbi:MAG: SpoIIE family protein phosphatase [Chloroflexia bacterium]|nr:SpoIIE family protein phosphatase [Chloroflexia bacterium]